MTNADLAGLLAASHMVLTPSDKKLKHHEIQVDLTELAAFFEEYLALLRKYQRTEPSDGARTVHTRFIAFPDPEEGA